MPRQRIYLKNSNWNLNVQRKLRIGTRKGGVSAFLMKTKDLVAVLADKSKAKYHANAITVLKNRTNLG